MHAHSIRLMRRALFLLLLTTAPALAQMGPANVIVAPLERRDVPVTQPLVASVEPVTRTTLATEVGGIVAERFFDEGQRVEKGALLARGLTDMAQAQRDAQDAAMQSAAARLEQAKAVAAAATRDRTRLEKLRSTDGSSEKELSDAITAEEVAAAVVPDVREADRHRARVVAVDADVAAVGDDRAGDVDRARRALGVDVINSGHAVAAIFEAAGHVGAHAANSDKCNGLGHVSVMREE